MSIEKFYIDSDNVVYLKGLKDVRTDAYINDATVTGQMKGPETAIIPASASRTTNVVTMIFTADTWPGWTDNDYITVSGTVPDIDETAVKIASVDPGNYTITYTDTDSGTVAALTTLGTVWRTQIGASITFSAIGSGGEYTGLIPTVQKLVVDDTYIFEITITKSGNTIKLRITRDGAWKGF